MCSVSVDGRGGGGVGVRGTGPGAVSGPDSTGLRPGSEILDPLLLFSAGRQRVDEDGRR